MSAMATLRVCVARRWLCGGFGVCCYRRLLPDGLRKRASDWWFVSGVERGWRKKTVG